MSSVAQTTVDLATSYPVAHMLGQGLGFAGQALNAVSHATAEVSSFVVHHLPQQASDTFMSVHAGAEKVLGTSRKASITEQISVAYGLVKGQNVIETTKLRTLKAITDVKANVAGRAIRFSTKVSTAINTRIARFLGIETATQTVNTTAEHVA